MDFRLPKDSLDSDPSCERKGIFFPVLVGWMLLWGYLLFETMPLESFAQALSYLFFFGIGILYYGGVRLLFSESRSFYITILFSAIVLFFSPNKQSDIGAVTFLLYLYLFVEKGSLPVCAFLIAGGLSSGATVWFGVPLLVFLKKRFRFLAWLFLAICGMVGYMAFEATERIFSRAFSILYVSQWGEYVQDFIEIVGCLLVLSFLRPHQNREREFRLTLFSLLLISFTLFTAFEIAEIRFLSAIVGVGIWGGQMRDRKPILTAVGFFIFAGVLLLYSWNPTLSIIRYLYIVVLSMGWVFQFIHLITTDFRSIPTPLSAAKSERIDIVLPCYNPHEGWVDLLMDRYGELQTLLNRKIRFIVVNDGSRKGITAADTLRLQTALPELLFVDNVENRGKGAAVRQGITLSEAEIILYTDWDFPYENSSLLKTVSLLESGYDVVVSRRNETYHRELSFRRKIMSSASRLLNLWVLGIAYSDTQGGLKGMSRKGREKMLSTTDNRFLFDTEFVYHADQDNALSLAEVEVHLRRGVVLPNMKKSVLKQSILTLLRIAWKG